MSSGTVPRSEGALEAEVIATIARVANVPPERLTPDVDLRRDLRFDSLMGLKILAALEKRFGVMIPDDEVDRYRTVAQAVEVVRRLTREAGQGG